MVLTDSAASCIIQESLMQCGSPKLCPSSWMLIFDNRSKNSAFFPFKRKDDMILVVPPKLVNPKTPQSLYLLSGALIEPSMLRLVTEIS